MKLYLFYTANTPADRDIAYLRTRLAERQIQPIEIDADSRDGAAMAELYDVVQRPAVVIVDGDGREIQKWQGQLPMAEDVSGYYAVS